MARRFEDLIIWQRSRKLVSDCFDLVELDSVRNVWFFKNQLGSASLSIMNNIAEGFERGRKKEFIHFLKIAKASAAEVRSMFYVMLDRQWISDSTFANLQQHVKVTAAGIQNLIAHLDSPGFGEHEPTQDTIRDGSLWSSEDLDASFFNMEEINS